jgi:hypothetical protein
MGTIMIAFAVLTPVAALVFTWASRKGYDGYLES